jgi:WD40 repeat protein
MNPLTKKPVIFLAFANTPVNGNYLKNLSIEQQETINALKKAEQKGLCEIVERPNTTIDGILDVFQDNTYKDRIAIFHYGGHAARTLLFLESHTSKFSYAHKEGLVSFFARQKSLKLIFLNACLTQQQALELKQAGIPAVIGTYRDIDDEVATQFALRFYNGIGSGHTLERAWREAEDEIRIRKCPQKYRDHFPWDIFVKEGAEEIMDWNLPDAAHNPLFGLPPIPQTYLLPDNPFLFLNRYERKHAELFYGRSHYIRQLYDFITDTAGKSSPIILLHGQSGVGKSSLLEAGLLPRLEESHTIIYIRRNQEKGLLGTLDQALAVHLFSLKAGTHAIDSTMGEKWQAIELKTNKPLVVIVDQVEEVYTHPNKNPYHELKDFLEALKSLFGNPMMYPQGKLILGYRKEYHPEIDKQLGMNALPRKPLFLQPLNRQDIIEVVTGLTNNRRLKAKYNLEIEDQLPVIIADDLLEDMASPVAPTLQILLTKMWDNSKQDDPASIHYFSIEQFRTLKRQGLLMEDFFNQQMEKLGNWKKEVIDSGLALDVLNFHTTELNTACSRDIKEIRHTYSHRQDMIDGLVKQLINLYLLADVQPDEDETRSAHDSPSSDEIRKSEGKTRLAHDILAPIVIKKYNDSDKPGQRAARILKAKIENTGNQKQVTYLDKRDVLTVEQGQKGMRKFIEEEKQLLQKSRRRNKVNIFLRNTAIVVIIVFAVVAAWQWGVAAKERRVALANYYSSQAQLKLVDYPAEAILLAKEAYLKDSNNNVSQVLCTAAAQTLEHPLYNVNFQHTYHVNNAVFSPSGTAILTASEDGTAKLWDLQGNLLRDFKHEKAVKSAVFSPDGRSILTVSRDKTARLWGLNGDFLQGFTHEKRINSAVFSPDGSQILTASDDRTIRLWSVQGRPLNVFSYRNEINLALFSPGGTRILTLCRDKKAWLLDMNGTPLKSLAGVNYTDFSPQGNYIVFVLFDNTVKVWNLGNNTEKVFKNFTGFVQMAVIFPGDSRILFVYLGGAMELRDLDGQLLTRVGPHKKSISSVLFSPDGTKILTTSMDSTAKLWDLNGDLVTDFNLHNDAVISAAFSPDGTQILTASRDNTAKLWDLKDQLLTGFTTDKDGVKFAEFSPDGMLVLTVSKENAVRLWDLRGNLKAILNKHTKIVHSAVFSPDGTRILTASADNTAKLWNLQGTIITDYNRHTDNVNSVAFSPDGRLILTASYDDTAKLWDLQGNLLQSYKHKKDVVSAQFSPDGRTVLTASFDETAKRWDLQGNLLNGYDKQYGAVTTAIFSPDGTKVLTVSETARLWEANGKLLTEFNFLKYITGKMSIEENYSISAAAFSPGSNRVLTVHNDNRARLWDLEGKLLTQLEHNAKIYSAIFSTDGTQVVTASADDTIKLWDMQGNLLAEFNKHKGDVYSAVFSPDGKRILSASADNTVKLWYTPQGVIHWLESVKNLPFRLPTKSSRKLE